MSRPWRVVLPKDLVRPVDEMNDHVASLSRCPPLAVDHHRATVHTFRFCEQPRRRRQNEQNDGSGAPAIAHNAASSLIDEIAVYAIASQGLSRGFVHTMLIESRNRVA
jgi:hypothetical protein